jgi:nucleoside phosphorylase
MTNDKLIILVPQGAEYNAVCLGVKSWSSAPLVLPIPVGMKPLTQYLENNFSQLPSQVLIMGLCGSLSAKYEVGDVVLYESCVYGGEVVECDRIFTSQLSSHLKPTVSLVKGLTSETVVYSTLEKRHLAETYSAEVVDMEGFAAINFLNKKGIAVALLRVVSDDAQHNIPNLNSAIDAKGNLQFLPLAKEMISQPIAAFHLIKGSLKALKILQKITSQLNLGFFN